MPVLARVVEVQGKLLQLYIKCRQSVRNMVKYYRKKLKKEKQFERKAFITMCAYERSEKGMELKMNVFEKIPENFFSILASQNKRLYIDKK